MQVLTLKVDDSASEKIMWLLHHFQQNEVQILDSETFVDDDTYLRSINGMVESLQQAREEDPESGTRLTDLVW